MNHIEQTPEAADAARRVWDLGRPWIIGKAAFSLDGFMARRESTVDASDASRWISGEVSRQDVQWLRATCDAILVGAATARTDDPQLTVREPAHVATPPWRVVVSRSGALPDHLRLLSDDLRHRTIVMIGRSWEQVWLDLFALGVRRVLVEGGGEVLDQLASSGWIDASVIYYAPFRLDESGSVRADGFRNLPLMQSKVEALGSDIKISGRVQKT